MEDPDFAKQNDRDSAARPLTDISTKLLKQSFDVPPRQAAAYGSGEDQLKGALVLPLHPCIVLPLGTRRDFRSTACWIRITLTLSGRQGVPGTRSELVVACPLQGLVRRCRISTGIVCGPTPHLQSSSYLRFASHTRAQLQAKGRNDLQNGVEAGAALSR